MISHQQQRGGKVISVRTGDEGNTCGDEHPCRYTQLQEGAHLCGVELIWRVYNSCRDEDSKFDGSEGPETWKVTHSCTAKLFNPVEFVEITKWHRRKTALVCKL